MRSELSEKETWEWIVAEIHAHGLRQRAHHIFKDSDIGRLAKKLLEPTERVLKEMNDRQRGYLVRDLRARLGSIATLAELRSTRSSRKRPGVVPRVGSNCAHNPKVGTFVSYYVAGEALVKISVGERLPDEEVPEIAAHNRAVCDRPHTQWTFLR